MTKYEKLKEAFVNGGSACAVQTLERISGGMTELIAFLYEGDEEIRFKAVKAIGALSEKMTHENRHEELRETVRRLLWTMNHESGATGWYSADAAGAIVKASRILSEEYSKLIIFHQNDKAFEVSVFRALAAIAEKHPQIVAGFRSDLEYASKSNNAEKKFWALIASFKSGALDANGLKNELNNEQETITVFNPETERMISVTPDEAAWILNAY